MKKLIAVLLFVVTVMSATAVFAGPVEPNVAKPIQQDTK